MQPFKQLYTHYVSEVYVDIHIYRQNYNNNVKLDKQTIFPVHVHTILNVTYWQPCSMMHAH